MRQSRTEGRAASLGHGISTLRSRYEPNIDTTSNELIIGFIQSYYSR